MSYGLHDGLSAFYRCPAEEAYSDRADSGPNGLHMGNGQNIGSAPGVRGGQGALFDGSDYLTRPGHPALDAGPGGLSVSVWFALAAALGPSQDAALVCRDVPGGGPRAWSLSLEPTPTPPLAVPMFSLFGVGGDAVAVVAFPSVPLVAGVWHHLLGWYDPDAGAAFLAMDGRPLGGVVLSGAPALANAPFSVGARGNGSGIVVGTLDEIGVWPRPLKDWEGNALWSGPSFPFGGP